MTDYNDGKWHGWNGGKCPVHPKSEVEAVCESTCHSGYGRVTWKVAGDMTWSETLQPIIAFRVVKEYREPREWWLTLSKWTESTAIHNNPCSASDYNEYKSNGEGEIIHVREVLE